MKYLFIAILFLFSIPGSIGQTYTIKGNITDTLNNVPLYRSSVVLIRISDSVIETYTRSTANGNFELRVPKQGKYILKATFPGFADYVEVINIKKSITDFGIVPMVSKEHLLKEFVLTKQISAIKIKGDTTEYMADSFKVKENATVEDLLKRLPGIQVDKNGNITAQGETVQKILVDGEEFFSDDPKVVTQGLQANAVEKVQVYDKKSDQAEFTGIDDGQKTKTINLELKDDKKKGYFGKVDAGGGTDGYFQNQAMINAFKKKRQISAFGIVSNTDKVGLGWQDNDKFGSGNGVTEISDDGGIMTTFTSSSDDDLGGWNGKYNGEGLPKTWTGGVHYADKWDGDKNHVTGNYRYAMQNVEIDGNTTTQYAQGGNNSLVSNQNKNQFSKGERHGFDAMYEWKIDSSTSVKLTANAGFKNSQTLSVYDTRTSFLVDTFTIPVNTNHRTIKSNSNADFVNADLLFRRKFAKKGRTISVDVKENYKDSKSDAFLNSTIDAYAIDSTTMKPDSTLSKTNQHKQSTTNTLAFSAKATYTEPLSKVAYVEIDYGLTVNNSASQNNSYDTNTNGSFSDAPNKDYSSNYKYNILSNIGGLNFKFVYQKINFSFGSDVSKADYIQTDLVNPDSSKKYSYTNLFPKANFTYKIGKQTNLNLTYQGSTQQPSITQIQPLRQNTDPLNITIGNPNLKQEFINKVTLRFNDFKILSSRFLWSNLSFTSFSNAISTSLTTTKQGENTTQYVNVNGNYTGFGYIGYGFKLKKIDLDLGLQVNGSVNHTNNYINDTANGSNNIGYGIGPYFSYNKPDKFDFNWEPEIQFNDNKSTISTYATSYWVFNSQFKGTVQLPLKFEMGSALDIMLRQKTKVFTSNNDVVKWNAWIGKKFLKKSQLELRASVYDILNQNIGYSRTAQGAILMQDNYNTIRRYGMLSLIWNFTHTPAGAPQTKQGGMMIIREE
ncbi:MAG: outer membrane beta-barrel protein [Chitinophagales bacterium]